MDYHHVYPDDNSEGHYTDQSGGCNCHPQYHYDTERDYHIVIHNEVER